MASPTPNKGYTYPAHGGSVNSWDTPIDADFDQIDLNLGGTYNVVMASTIAGVVQNSTYATVSSTATMITFLTSIAQNMYFNVTGTTTAVVSLQYPGVGSFYLVNNATSGSGINFVTAASTLAPATATAGIQIVVTDGTNANTATPPAAEFASGTAIIFAQAAAPSGWTQDLTVTGNAVCIISSAVTSNTSTSGTWTISGISVGNHTLSTGEIPSHNHSYNVPNNSTTRSNSGSTDIWAASTSGATTGNAGGGGGHNHSVSTGSSWRPVYYMVIRATKN